jgi:parvulin-like peptidyl-prolyl isomerase
MRRVVLAVVLTAAVARAADTAPVATATPLPAGTWAMVGSRAITKDEVVKRARSLPLGLVLDALIDEQVLAIGLDREGIAASSVADAEVEKFLGGLRERAKLQGVDFDTQLKAEGVTLDEVKTKLRMGLAFQKRVEREATDDALRAWFAKHELELGGEVRATHVLLALKGSDDTATFQRALAVLAKVKADGSNVAALARELSDDVNAPLDGGDLDFFGAGSGAAPPEVVEACFARGKKGLVTRPVRSRRGYHVIFVTDTRFTEPPAFERHRGQVQMRFLDERAREIHKSWRAAVKIELAPDAPRPSR